MSRRPIPIYFYEKPYSRGELILSLILLLLLLGGIATFLFMAFAKGRLWD